MINNDVDECPICLDELLNKHICILECKHKFHENCITIYVLSKRDKIDKVNCPLCRHKINVVIEDNSHATKTNNTFIIICIIFILFGFLGVYLFKD